MEVVFQHHPVVETWKSPAGSTRAPVLFLGINLKWGGGIDNCLGGGRKNINKQKKKNRKNDTESRGGYRH